MNDEKDRRNESDGKSGAPETDGPDTLGPASETDPERLHDDPERDRGKERDADDLAASDGVAEVVQGIPGEEAGGGGDDDGRVAEEVREQKRSRER